MTPPGSSLLGQLGYRYPKRNFARRAIVRLASSPPAGWVAARVMPSLDRRLLSVSNGRFSLSEVVAGTPVIALTTTGAKSGQPRTAYLLAIPVDGQVAVIGTNFAQTETPAWVHNLRRQPEGSLTYRGQRLGVVAREVQGSEYERVFAAAGLVYPGYAVYRARLTKREPKVFVLERSENHNAWTMTDTWT